MSAAAPLTFTSRPKKALFAAAIGVVVLLALEGVGRLVLPEPVPDLRGGTVGNQLPYDPDTRFVVEHSDGRRGLPGGGTFHAQEWTMPAEKLRIAIVGDSTIHGPFTDVFHAGLSLGQPHETLNFGVFAIASDRARILANVAVEQDLDLLVVYVGHNEHLEARLNPRSLTPLDARGRWWPMTRGGLARLVRRAWPQEGATARSSGPSRREFGAVSDGQAAAVAASYRANLDGICRSAAARGVPVAFVVPISSLIRPPEHAPSTPEYQMDAFLLRARKRLGAEPGLPADALSQGAPPLDAPSERYLEGLQAIALQDRTAAVAALRAARLEDPHPWRVAEPLMAVIREVAGDCGARVVEPEPAFLADERYLQPDDPLFVDQVHPSAAGARVLAAAVHNGLAPLLPDGARWSDPGPNVGADPTNVSEAERGYRLPAR
jgi:lysophospholipase L1-like esterase